MSGEATASAPPLRIQVEGGPAFEMAEGEDTLLRAALRAGLPWPYECSVGGCGACRYELVEGEVATLWPEAPGLSERERRRGKRLACQSRPLQDCRVRVRLEAPPDEEPIPPRPMQATVVGRHSITPDMDAFVLQSPGQALFRPGQYALLYPPGVVGARAYSMANLPNAEGRWHFIVRRVPGGAGSQALFASLHPGASVLLDGPYGHGHLRAGERDVVCVAGGSGLGPMLSVARGVLAQAGARRVHFFLGLRQQAELGALREFEGLDPARVQVHTALSAPVPGEPWAGHRGFVHEMIAPALPAPLDQYDHYFAGPPPMVEAVQQLLMVQHRVPFGQLHFDRFV